MTTGSNSEARGAIATTLLLALLVLASAQPVLHYETVEYRQDTTNLEGYLAYGESDVTPRPGILVFHDWTGVGPYVKHRVDQLAALGYVALAADIYGKGIRPTDPKQAAATAGIYRTNRTLMRERARAGLAELLRNPRVDKSRVVAIGYCFGGGVALELARSGADLTGVVTFHGTLDTPTPEDAKNIKGKVLVLQGADDPAAPIKQIADFEQEMRNAKVDYQIVLYGGTVHSFTIPTAGNDPATGSAYNAQSDRRAWEAMMTFFRELFTKHE